MADLGQSATAIGLIGGLGMTRVSVYNQRAAPDGQQSGCPHVHAICAEAYYVLEGRGHVELHDLERGMYRAELEPGTYLQFPPRVLHRLVSEDGLVILGIMSNAGLAENGDARIYFGKETDSDPMAYEAAVGLVSKGLEGALQRRDLAVKGYLELMRLWQEDRAAYFEELGRFIRLHVELVEGDPCKYQPYVETGPKGWGRYTEALLYGEVAQTGRTPVTQGTPARPAKQKRSRIIRNTPGQEYRFGMCGLLHLVKADSLHELNNLT